MLSLLFMAKKKKRKLEESVVLIQQGDQTLLNETIDSYKPFIAKTVSSVCKRYIYESDDEFSIGLIAFNEAIEKYTPERGSSLLSFAEVIIKRRVIDYIRKQVKDQHLSMDLTSTSLEEDTPATGLVDKLSLEDFQKKQKKNFEKRKLFIFRIC